MQKASEKSVHENIVESFFARHNFVRKVDIGKLASLILEDMQNGLCKKTAFQDMIQTFLLPPKNVIKSKDVIVIDAGGTNFRSCLVSFSSEGRHSISMLEKTSMPGVEKELSKVEFFAEIARNINHLKNKSDTIGFCFSYPVQITEDADGILKMFSKEVHAPEVVGQKIGECLNEVLLQNGWQKMKIILLNDTVSALLAGASSLVQKYSSYIGLILGTGLNAAYIQPSVTFENGCTLQEQIVVCESGKFSNVVVSDFDMALTQKTQAPEMSLLEKQCSGAYLANCALEVLKSAASENLFSSCASEKINSLKSFSLKDTDEFLFSYYEQKQSELSPSELLQSKLVPSENLFSNICASEEDCDILFELLDAVMERSARNMASVLVACALQSGAGHDKDKPICITANGSTYYKTFKMSERIHSYLKEELTQKMNIHWEIISVEDDITLGSAIGAFAKE